MVMDAGMATDAYVTWLVEHGYRHLVVRRGGRRQFDETRAVTLETASKEWLHLHKELSWARRSGPDRRSSARHRYLRRRRGNRARQLRRPLRPSWPRFDAPSFLPPSWRCTTRADDLRQRRCAGRSGNFGSDQSVTQNPAGSSRHGQSPARACGTSVRGAGAVGSSPSAHQRDSLCAASPRRFEHLRLQPAERINRQG